MNINKTAVAKKLTSVVIGIGTSAVVKGIIENNVTAPNIPMKVAVFATSIVIGSMATKATVKHSDEMIDEIIAEWKGTTDNTEEAK